MIQLDTSLLIRALMRGSPQDRQVREWLRSGQVLAMSTIAWTEFLCGPVQAHHVELATHVVHDRLPFFEEDAVLAAELFNHSGRRRGTLADCMIAATAMRSEASLATANPADFRRLEKAGLRLIVV